MPELWMLEDLEPWPDAPEAGSICEPTTFWASPKDMDLPAEVCSEVQARIETVTADTGTERVAHLGNGFTTMMRSDDERVGDVTLTGCLIWDRYLSMDYRTRPRGRIGVLERRGLLVQRATHHATRWPGAFSVTYDGPVTLTVGNRAPEGFGVRWHALLVENVSSPPP